MAVAGRGPRRRAAAAPRRRLADTRPAAARDLRPHRSPPPPARFLLVAAGSSPDASPARPKRSARQPASSGLRAASEAAPSSGPSCRARYPERALSPARPATASPRPASWCSSYAFLLRHRRHTHARARPRLDWHAELRRLAGPIRALTPSVLVATEGECLTSPLPRRLNRGARSALEVEAPSGVEPL